MTLEAGASMTASLHGAATIHLSLAGWVVAGIAETDEMFVFRAERGILPECEMDAPGGIATAWERMERADVR